MSTLLRIRRTQPGDVEYIAEHLTPDDVDILKDQVTGKIADGLKGSVAASAPNDYTVITINGVFENPAALLGVRPVQQDGKLLGEVWCVGTESIRRPDTWRTFSKESRKWITHQARRFGKLYTLEDERSDLHIKWLQFCGFRPLGRQWWSPEAAEWKMGEAIPGGVPFLLMVK